MEKSKMRVGNEVHDLADAKVREFVGYGGLEYELSANGNYYIVTGRGGVTGSEIVIPDTYQGKPVLEVADNAFKDDAEITKFVVGRYIIRIGVGNIETLANLTELYFTADCQGDFGETLENATGMSLDELDFENEEEVGYFMSGDSYCIRYVCEVFSEWDEEEGRYINHQFTPKQNVDKNGNGIEDFRSQWERMIKAPSDYEYYDGIHLTAFAF